MTKETWKQFAERVKPNHGRVFEDAYGTEWVYDDHHGLFYLVWNTAPCISDSTCPLADAIEHVEYVDKPKIRKLKFYCYLAVDALYWTTKEYMKDPRALDEHGERVTKEVWLE